MSVFKQRSQQLDRFEFQYGRQRGRLAATMDILTDLAVLLGTHTAYCQAAKTSPQPARDMREALRQIEHAKELIASLLHGPAVAPPADARPPDAAPPSPRGARAPGPRSLGPSTNTPPPTDAGD